MDESTLQDIFTLAGGPISWDSKLQLVVDLLATEDEYVVAIEGNKEAIWLE